jgi:hypothetical protein
MSIAGKQVLFISYNGMLDPLGQSQVIPYLKELSKLGAQFTLLSYERDHAFGPEGQQRCKVCAPDWPNPGLSGTGCVITNGRRFRRRLSMWRLVCALRAG